MYTCASSDILTTLKRDFLVTNILPEAEAMLENALHVREPATEALRLNFNECGYVQVPAGVKNPGVTNQDLLVFVTAWAVPASQSTLAYAISCAVDSLGRPVGGQINFAPHQLQAEASKLRFQVVSNKKIKRSAARFNC